MSRQGTIKAAALLVLFLVLGPAGPAEPRTPKPVKVFPGAMCSFASPHPCLVFCGTTTRAAPLCD